MQLTLNRNGVSLIELVIAVSIVVSVVAGLSVLFPKASQNTARIQQRSIATNLAQSQIQIMKSRAYAFTDTTDTLPGVGQFNALCDCAAIGDLSILPSTGTALAGTTFTVASCVHFVEPASLPGNPWTSQCYDSTDPNTDTGYKHIVVYVSWTHGAETYSTSQESMISRY